MMCECCVVLRGWKLASLGRFSCGKWESFGKPHLPSGRAPAVCHFSRWHLLPRHLRQCLVTTHGPLHCPSEGNKFPNIPVVSCGTVGLCENIWNHHIWILRIYGFNMFQYPRTPISNGWSSFSPWNAQLHQKWWKIPASAEKSACIVAGLPAIVWDDIYFILFQVGMIDHDWGFFLESWVKLRKIEKGTLW